RCLSDWSSDVCSSDLYVVTVLPVSGVFQNGPQIAADRYSYLPSLPWAVLAGAGAIAGWNAWRERRGRSPALAVPGAAALVIIVQIGRASCRERGESAG